jgi:hypothetical protein
MLNRQIDYFIGKYGRLAKFTAADFLHCSMEEARWSPQTALSDAILNRTKASFHDSP